MDSTDTSSTHQISMGLDPFLVEALQNPRHRLTILRMELDIQNFLRNSNQQQFEFQHFPTSYLRLAAHRVAQHYGLLTMVQDNSLDGQGMKILVKRLADSIYPAVCLSDIPVQQSDNDKLEQKKIVIRPRPKASNGSSELGKRSSIRTVEERKEEYDRARARIFSGPNSPESEDTVSQYPLNGKTEYSLVDESEATGYAVSDLERNYSGRDGGVPSRVAIFRDREKDRSDPDYDRSYNRRDAVYMQWPSHAMMYPQPYDQFRHAVFQAPFCQQPLSFEYSQNH